METPRAGFLWKLGIPPINLRIYDHLMRKVLDSIGMSGQV